MLKDRVVTEDFLIESQGLLYAGHHLLIDLYGATRLDDVAFMKQAFERATKVAQATLLHLHVHHFGPGHGVTGIAVLSESHMSVHTWPERGYAAFDVFMCGRAEPEKTVAVFEDLFLPERIEVCRQLRGEKLA